MYLVENRNLCLTGLSIDTVSFEINLHLSTQTYPCHKSNHLKQRGNAKQWFRTETLVQDFDYAAPLRPTQHIQKLYVHMLETLAESLI